MNYSGADWIEKTLKKELSPLGKDVADILGAVYLGIYHIDQGRNNRALDRADWSDTHCIVVRLPKNYSLSSYDSSELTGLVLLAHDKAVRIEITAVFGGFFELVFHQRKREGNQFERHPTIEKAMEDLRKGYGTGTPL
jgi:hypothetical protein